MFMLWGAEGHDHKTSQGEERVREEGGLHCLPIFNVPWRGGRNRIMGNFRIIVCSTRNMAQGRIYCIIL